MSLRAARVAAQGGLDVASFSNLAGPQARTSKLHTAIRSSTLLQIPALYTTRARNAHEHGRRSLHASPAVRDFHFDTHHFVQRLEREGLNRAQAEGIMTAMAEVIDESIRNMTSNMVTKADQEKVRPTLDERLFGSE